jgi:hypothetical protein
MVTTTPVTNIIDEIAEGMDVLLTCFELLMITITGLTGQIDNILGGNITGASPYGPTLPITDPLTLFTAAAADSLICLQLAQAILQDPNDNTAVQICDSILATASPLPTATAATLTGATATFSSSPTDTSSSSTDNPTPTGTSTATYIPPPNINHGLPPSWPTASVLTAANSSFCAACKLSGFLTTIRSEAAQCNFAGSISPGPPPEQELITVSDLSSYLCKPGFIDAGFRNMCTAFCKDTCAICYVDVIVKGLGATWECECAERASVWDGDAEL